MRPVHVSLSLHLVATALLGAQALALAFALAGPTPIWGRLVAVGVTVVLATGLFRRLSSAAPPEEEQPEQ
jgi:hypothetical protein